ncbi:MAG: DUF1934 domain-containing protein [Clostridiales bacterium]|nr:DUF1934 domain-containing protein [Candidatus Blautia equi]
MDKEVLIRVVGTQVQEGEEAAEPIEILVPGQYFLKNGTHYFRYEEYMEDFKDPTLNYIKYNDHKLEVRKQGLINVTMVFEPGKRTVSFYTTPYGTIEMGLTTRKLDIRDQDENHVCVSVHYAMDMNDQHTSDCTLTLEAFAKHVIQL